MFSLAELADQDLLLRDDPFDPVIRDKEVSRYRIGRTCTAGPDRCGRRSVV